MGFTTNPSTAGYPGIGGPIGFGQGTFGPSGVSPFAGLGQGLQHSGFNPYIQNSLINPFFNPVVAMGGIGRPGVGLGLGYGTGLLHSNPDLVEQQLIELRANDPYRLSVTFPNAFTPTTIGW